MIHIARSGFGSHAAIAELTLKFWENGAKDIKEAVGS
jgi:hypothetical protein